MLVHAEAVALEYLTQEMCWGEPPEGKFDFFVMAIANQCVDEWRESTTPAQRVWALSGWSGTRLTM